MPAAAFDADSAGAWLVAREFDALAVAGIVAARSALCTFWQTHARCLCPNSRTTYHGSEQEETNQQNKHTHTQTHRSENRAL